MRRRETAIFETEPVHRHDCASDRAQTICGIQFAEPERAQRAGFAVVVRAAQGGRRLEVHKVLLLSSTQLVARPGASVFVTHSRGEVLECGGII